MMIHNVVFIILYGLVNLQKVNMKYDVLTYW